MEHLPVEVMKHKGQSEGDATCLSIFVLHENGQSREPPCKYHKNPVFQEAEHRIPGEVLRPGTVVNNFILSTWESEAGKSL